MKQPKDNTSPQRIVLFDGICNFCNFWIQFALKRDRKGKLLFTSLQGETARTILPQFGIDPAVLTSVIFIDDGMLPTPAQRKRFLD